MEKKLILDMGDHQTTIHWRQGVVKKTVMFAHNHHAKTTIAHMASLVPYLIDHPKQDIVEVYSFKALPATNLFPDGGYSYEMAECSSLSIEEFLIFDIETGATTNCKYNQFAGSYKYYDQMLGFLDRVSPYYNDLHNENIMKRYDSKRTLHFCVIDLESFFPHDRLDKMVDRYTHNQNSMAV